MDGTVARIYNNFRGVDFRGEEVSLNRSPDSINMWKNYKETDSIRTRPAMEAKTTFPAAVYGISFYKDIMLVHSGKNIYKVTSGGQKTILFTGANQIRSSTFVYEGIWYFKDGVNYLSYDGNTVAEVDGYVPTTSIGRKPAGGGTKYEDVNMLTGRRINTFLADNMSFDFFLDTRDLDTDFPPIVKVNDEIVEAYTVDYAEGKISFTAAPPSPNTDGQDNVSVEFRKTVQTYRESILGCTLLQVFDNRVFFSGNPLYPNVVWHCSLNDPSYCSDLDYYREGMDSSQIKGLVAGNNALWVFREPSDANTTIFYHTPTLDADYGKIYPSTHSSITLGCVGAAINFGDDIVFFSERGMEGISGDITTEQVAAHRSTLVDRRMAAQPEYRNMILEEWEGYLLVFIGSCVYLADSRAVFTNENHVEYEWFYWEMDRKITCSCVREGVLYLGTEDGIYTLTDESKDLSCHWVTAKDKFKYPHMLKTTNKRGCVAEATGDITVEAKTEKTGFEEIGEYTGITDYFVSRIKRKKFKDIQLRFSSKTRFSLESVTLECFIGGYIKR